LEDTISKLTLTERLVSVGIAAELAALTVMGIIILAR